MQEEYKTETVTVDEKWETTLNSEELKEVITEGEMVKENTKQKSPIISDYNMNRLNTIQINSTDVDIDNDDELGGEIWDEFVECEESSFYELLHERFEEYLTNEMDILANKDMDEMNSDTEKLNHLLKERWLTQKLQNIELGL